ncbi:MAG TPA: aldehyde dehydrogenase family protein, partial [Solirubrobacteraceae bacterium]|nr:aldehyde dehydrogenase family protein [Solirubrobacteraceae bacterium]
MATAEHPQIVEQPAPSENGVAPANEDIQVENPATGEIVATVPDLGADAIAAMAKRARAAQPGWEAYGFEGRARILMRAQKWLMDNSEQVIQTIVSETGKTFE